MYVSITLLICLVSVNGFQFNRHCRARTNFSLKDARLAVDLTSLSRPELQALAKQFGIKANGKSAEMIQQLAAIKTGGAVPTTTKSTKKAAADLPTQPPSTLVPEVKVSRLQERALQAKKKLVESVTSTKPEQVNFSTHYTPSYPISHIRPHSRPTHYTPSYPLSHTSPLKTHSLYILYLFLIYPPLTIHYYYQRDQQHQGAANEVVKPAVSVVVPPTVVDKKMKESAPAPAPAPEPAPAPAQERAALLAKRKGEADATRATKYAAIQKKEQAEAEAAARTRAAAAAVVAAVPKPAPVVTPPATKQPAQSSATPTSSKTTATSSSGTLPWSPHNMISKR